MALARFIQNIRPRETAHIILSGEMMLAMNGRTVAYRAGDRCDVAAGAVHSAKMGHRAAAISLRSDDAGKLSLYRAAAFSFGTSARSSSSTT